MTVHSPIYPGRSATPHVQFVGAGPGDPGLLTVAALRAIESAEVILHDRLVSDAILALAPARARLIAVGKEGFGPAIPQSRINDALIIEALRGPGVVRLKAGDPGVFGRLDEETRALDAAGIDWSIVPGISAATAAAASLGQSLTRRGRNATMRIVSAQSADGLTDCDWADLARRGAVTAFYMGKRAAPHIQAQLLAAGADPDTPVDIVENASRPSERVVRTVLSSLADDLAAARMSGPAVILVGLVRADAPVLLETVR